MQKIIEQSLKLAGYANASELARVVNATPNPIVAAEMLLGVFEEICPETIGRYWRSKYKSESNVFYLDHVDSLRNVIKVKRYSYNTKTAYFITKEDYSNKVHVLERPSDYYTTGSVRVNGFDFIDEEHSLEKLNDSFVAMSQEEFLQWQEEALGYGIDMLALA
jgi:hypothetical protein